MTAPSETGVFAIDIGGTKIAFAEVDGERLTGRLQVATPRSGRGDDLIAVIAREVAARSPARLAIATTGIVSRGIVTALNPDTLPIEPGFALAARVEAQTGLRPTVVNDAQAAAWGEFLFGAGRGCRNFMFVTVSTGVGAGIVVDDTLLVGSAGFAGHMGHMTIQGAPWVCGCGRTGCLETIASGTAIARRFGEAAEPGVQAPRVFEAAAAGNARADQIIEDAAQALAETIANVIAAADLDRVAIGGGVGLASGFLDRVRRHASRVPILFRREIVAAVAGPDAGLLGVAGLDALWRKSSPRFSI